MKRPMLFVALDGMGLDEAKTRKTLQIAHELHRTGLPFGFKVNLDYVLEYGVEFIDDDELVEITPKSVRLRKRFLKEHERKRAGRA